MKRQFQKKKEIFECEIVIITIDKVSKVKIDCLGCVLKKKRKEKEKGETFFQKKERKKEGKKKGKKEKERKEKRKKRRTFGFSGGLTLLTRLIEKKSEQILLKNN